MNQKDVDECLAVLYMRLNGYFTTGVIVHSPIHGQATTEVDCLAVRLPHHQQDERVVAEAPFLNIEKGFIDLIVCEVKSDPSKLAFNDSIKKDIDALSGIIKWAGVFPEEAVYSVASRLLQLLSDGVPIATARAGFIEDKVRVRALLCCPPKSSRIGDQWCLNGEEIIRYADECFNPCENRPTCSVRYNFQQWSYPLNQIVSWLKDKKRKQPATLLALYEHFGIHLPV